MRRRKQLVETDNHQRWIVSYADLITLLFAFFVVMYAVSSVSLDKLQKFVDSTDQAFKPVASNELTTTPMQQHPIVNQVDEFEQDQVILRQHARWAELEIKSKALFPSGSAKLTRSAEILLAKLAYTLKKTNHYISVEGYTDNRGIATVQFPSNWELSAARAAAVVRSLTESGVNPSKIQAVGYGEQHPVSDNLSPEGRSANRRVVIILSKEKTSPRLLQPSLSQQATIIQAVKATAQASQTVQSTVKPIEPKPNVVKPDPNQEEVPVVKAVRLKNGGLKFTSGTAKVRKGAQAPLIVEEKAKE